MADDHVPFDLIGPWTEAYDGAEKKRLLGQRQPPPFLSHHERGAQHYQPSRELLLAINMALHTGSPLLLTGEPGTGKTQAATFVGKYFGIRVFPFVVKSTSIAQDLLYEFDAVGYLHWAQAAKPESPTLSPEALQEETEAFRRTFLHPGPLWQAYEEADDAVVLIDEIDKAPRDFPNDLLHELDQHSFANPLDRNTRIEPKSGRGPIVIITSNEERRLPEAFLRRCIWHHIELTQDLVQAAVESLASASGEDGGSFPNLGPAELDAARQRFWMIRDLPGIDKPPATAELLTWLCILSARRVRAEELSGGRLRDLPSIEALIKNNDDLKRLEQH